MYTAAMRYGFGNFVLDTELGELRFEDTPVELRKQAFRLLAILVERAPALLERDTLLDEVWGRTALSPNALPQTISELRRILDDRPRSPRYIQTVHRRGYRFVTEVRHLAAPESAQRTSAEALSSRRRTMRAWLLAASLIAAVGTAGGWIMQKRSSLDAAVTSAQSDPHARQRIRLAVAPLPKAPSVPDWLPRVSVEMLAQKLGKSRIQLVRSDALGLDDRPGNARWQHQAHELLGADAALTGHWRAARAQRVILDLSVIELASGTVLASRQLAADINELDRLMTEASTRVARALDLPAPEAAASPQTLTSDDGKDYSAAMAALDRNDARTAAARLQDLHQGLGKPRWIEPVLLKSLEQAGQPAAALSVISNRLGQAQSLALGERLRLEAQSARLRHRPEQAASAWRALIDLYPDAIDSRLALIETQLDALQGDSARHSLAQLETLPIARHDPRLGLLRARIAMLDAEPARAVREAVAVADLARHYHLPKLALDAAMAEAAAWHGSGQLDKATATLAAADKEWSEQVRHQSALFALRLRQVRIRREQGRLDAASMLLERLESEPWHAAEMAQVRIESALLHLALQQTEQARIVLDQVKEQVGDSVDPDVQIGWLDARALTAAAQHEYAQANEFFDQAFALARARGRAAQHVALQVNAGTVLARARRFTEATVQWQQALDTFTALADRRGQAICLGNLAAAASSQGQAERSVELNTRALELFRQLKLPGPRARTAYNLALAASRDGKLEQAAKHFSEAATAWRSSGQTDLVLRAATGHSEATLATGDVAGARKILASVPALHTAAPLSRSHVLATRAHIALAQGKLESSRDLMRSARELRQQDGHTGWVALSDLELLRLDLLQGHDPLRVQIAARELARNFERAGETRDVARAWLLVAEAQLCRQKRPQALKSLERAEQASAAFADQTVDFDLEWTRAWASPDAERRLRLQALAVRATAQGYGLQVMRIDAALADESLGAPKSSLALPPYARISN